MADTLPEALGVQVAAVLQDCANQLAVLGVANVAADEDDNSMKTMAGESIGKAVSTQKRLESDYDKLLSERESLVQRSGVRKAPGTRTGFDDGGFLSFRRDSLNIVPERLQQVEQSLAETTRLLKQGTRDLVATIKANPSATKNIQKLHRERQVMQDIIEQTAHEILQDNTFFTILDAVEEEAQNKDELMGTIERQEESTNHIVYLQDMQQQLVQDKAQRLQELDETIAQLKDQLQETKSRVADEGKYIKKEAAVMVSVEHKHTQKKIKDLEDLKQETRRVHAEEQDVHAETMWFLNENFAELTEKLEEWTQKNERVTDEKQTELEELKAQRASDLDKLAKMTEKYEEMKTIVENDRKRREKQRQQAQQAVLDLSAAIKIQAWWRGMCVRHKMGPFKSSKGKGKKGKGSGKKKKKKK